MIFCLNKMGFSIFYKIKELVLKYKKKENGKDVLVSVEEFLANKKRNDRVRPMRMELGTAKLCITL